MFLSNQNSDMRQGLVKIVVVTLVAFLVTLAAAIACYPGHDAAAGGYRFCYVSVFVAWVAADLWLFNAYLQRRREVRA